ncbi:hypothetical protein KA111_00415 [Candidatus Woesebacteria bacterium]|nr:hypothetical protein [Candidatus Woesebacteria bacterium]
MAQAKLFELAKSPHLFVSPPRRVEKQGVCLMLFAPKEKGQGLQEYLILLALIAIFAILVFTAYGGEIKELFEKIKNSMNGVL